MTSSPCKIVLREERRGRDKRFLWAHLDDEGALHIEGQDLGPATEPVSSDGEYEWSTTIRATHVGRLVELLGGDPGAEILSLLRTRFTGMGSYELERLIRESDIPVERSVY